MHNPKLSDTARCVMIAASVHPDQLAIAPARLPSAAKRAVMQSLLKAGLLEKIEAESSKLAFRISKTGVEAIASALSSASATKQPDPEVAAPRGDLPGDNLTPPPRPTLRAAAQAVLHAWDRLSVPDCPDLESTIAALQTALPRSVRASSPRSSQPRTDTKRALVLVLLRRPEGATVAQVVDATGWARHTVHGFFAGLKKQGIRVDVLERVRQVGAGQGAKGSYTVYRAIEAG